MRPWASSPNDVTPERVSPVGASPTASGNWSVIDRIPKLLEPDVQ